MIFQNNIVSEVFNCISKSIESGALCLRRWNVGIVLEIVPVANC